MCKSGAQYSISPLGTNELYFLLHNGLPVTSWANKDLTLLTPLAYLCLSCLIKDRHTPESFSLRIYSHTKRQLKAKSFFLWFNAASLVSYIIFTKPLEDWLGTNRQLQLDDKPLGACQSSEPEPFEPDLVAESGT